MLKILKHIRRPWAIVLIFAAGIIGFETLAMYLCFPSYFDDFVATMPLHAFITLLWCLFVRVYGLVLTVRKGLRAGAKPAPATQSSTPAPASMSIPVQPFDRIAVRHGQKIKLIPLEEILYFQADGDYVSIHTAEGHWLKEQTMKYSEEVLPAKHFLRIHRSCIVNLNHISRIERYGERQSVVLHNGESIRISTSRVQILKKVLGI